MIEGVTLTPLRCIHTPKGDVRHALKATEDTYRGFGEAYFSEIHFGEWKGWKRHNRMTLNIVVVTGRVKFIICDNRTNSPTCGQQEEIVLSPDTNYQRLTIAPGLWMAFEGLSQGTSILLDIIPEPHDPQEADSCEWEDLKL